MRDYSYTDAYIMAGEIVQRNLGITHLKYSHKMCDIYITLGTTSNSYRERYFMEQILALFYGRGRDIGRLHYSVALAEQGLEVRDLTLVKFVSYTCS